MKSEAQPEPKPLDITTMTVEQLKALAFDLIVQRDQIQASLTAVLQQIEQKHDNNNK